MIAAIKQFWKPINAKISVQPAPNAKKLAPSLNSHSSIPATSNPTAALPKRTPLGYEPGMHWEVSTQSWTL